MNNVQQQTEQIPDKINNALESITKSDNTIKNKVINILLFVLGIPICIILSPLLICLFIWWIIFRARNKTKKQFPEFIFNRLGNTEYKLTCPDCGYSRKIPSGSGHDFEKEIGTFLIDLVYCPECKEPLSYYSRSRNGETTDLRNDKCPICGKKTKSYNRNFPEKLICPKCKSENLKIVDTESMWMT